MPLTMAHCVYLHSANGNLDQSYRYWKYTFAMTVCLSVGLLVSLSICHNFQKGGKIHLHAPIGALVIKIRPPGIWIQLTAQTGLISTKGQKRLQYQMLTSTVIQHWAPSAWMEGKMTNLTVSSLTVWRGESALAPAQNSLALTFLMASFFT